MLEKIETENRPESMEDIAGKNFEMWNKALEDRDPRKVAELYTEDATFLPTLSGKFVTGRPGVEEYFEHFLKKNPIGEIIQGKIQTIETDGVIQTGYYSQSGDYNFEVDLDGDKNKRHTIRARFTFNWQKDDQGEWKIKHHHSSLNPEPEIKTESKEED